ncbi:Short-chain dehydrogenase [Lentzea albida]|uniref:Short-chain dehydrogenase n=1 Tax=Lentzea albida TaxID=65499 RepID=A0A1H9MMN6_9PSEU|nr:Short-chain dehydrogenase [Lentzea albida]
MSSQRGTLGEVTTSSKNRLVVVTGASTGMGAATARELARQGFHVLAGVRRESDGEAVRSGGVEPVVLDITKPDHVAALVARVDGDPLSRPLHALVNNAGVPGAGPVEATPLSQWRHLFEVNLFGHIAVTQALLPALRRGKGRVVNISSMNGKISMAGYGPYAGTKFALEAVSDALRQELAPQGVPVVIVEPGGVQTDMAARGTSALHAAADELTPEQEDLYRPLLRALPSHVAAFTKAGVTSAHAAERIAKTVTDRRPRIRYTIGRDAGMLLCLARFLPDRVLDRLLGANLRPHFPA